MKIAFVSTGSIRELATLKRATGMAPYLQQAGHEVVILLADTPANHERLKLECPDVEAVWLQAAGAFAERAAKQKHLEALAPDWTYVCGYGVRNAVSIGTPGRVAVEHCELGSKTLTHSWPRRLLELLLEYRSMRVADLLICASRYLEQLYAQRLQRRQLSRPILYLPYAWGPVDAPTPEQLAAGQRLRDKRDGVPAVLYMGAIRKNYGAFDMVDAAARLKQAGRNCRFELIGEGPELAAVQAQIEQRGLQNMVQCHGYVADELLPEHLAAADVFLAPLQSTPQDLARCPSKVFLYLAYSKPIVTCGFGEPKEVLGNDGFYYSPSNSADLAEAVGRALDVADQWTGGHFDLECHTWKHRTHEFLQGIAQKAAKP